MTPLSGDSPFPIAEPDATSGDEEGIIQDMSFDMMNGGVNTPEPAIVSELSAEQTSFGIQVTHSSIYLSCDMSQYVTTIDISKSSIDVSYMPMDDERPCLYDVEYSIVYEFAEGHYTLHAMEDSKEMSMVSPE